MEDVVEDDVRAAVVSGLAQLFEEGCPLPGPGQRDAMAEVAVRRWVSYSRRHRGGTGMREQRIRDLVKGLVRAFEAEPRLVGPLVKDYECVAEAVAAVIAPTEAMH